MLPTFLNSSRIRAGRRGPTSSGLGRGSPATYAGGMGAGEVGKEVLLFGHHAQLENRRRPQLGRDDQRWRCDPPATGSGEVAWASSSVELAKGKEKILGGASSWKSIWRGWTPMGHRRRWRGLQRPWSAKFR